MKSMPFHAVLEPTGWRAPFVSNKTTDQTHRSREKKEGGKKILMHHTAWCNLGVLWIITTKQIVFNFTIGIDVQSTVYFFLLTHWHKNLAHHIHLTLLLNVSFHYFISAWNGVAYKANRLLFVHVMAIHSVIRWDTGKWILIVCFWMLYCTNHVRSLMGEGWWYTGFILLCLSIKKIKLASLCSFLHAFLRIPQKKNKIKNKTKQNHW